MIGFISFENLLTCLDLRRSFFALQAGASKVYGIDASNIIEMAKKIVAQNRAEGKIILFRGKAEEVELPEKCDIVISEWMGYALLYEAMLPSVIAIRDKYMKPGGKMFPRYSNIWLCPFSDPDYYSSRVNFWSKNLYGLDFTPLQYARDTSPTATKLLTHLLLQAFCSEVRF